MSQPATRESWPNVKPLPQERTTLPIDRAFTEKEYELISLGVVPEAMEDKWFIFLEEDVLYVHRSWTGFCIYQVSLKQDGTQYRIVEAMVNRDPNQYSATDDDYDARLLTFLIDNFLLQGCTTFPVPAGVPLGIATGLYHHHVAGVGPRARPTTEITPMSAVRWFGAWLKWLIRG